MDLSISAFETFFAALADYTRLRILNLLRGGEVCVCFFSEVLGESQPKISRHLAYLRNANLVVARRDGKWMHYSINIPHDEAMAKALIAALDAARERKDMLSDREKYRAICCSPDALAQISRSPMPFIYADANVIDQPSPPETQNAAHNELEEFLL